MAINFNAFKNASSEAGNLIQKLPTTDEVIRSFTKDTLEVRENFGAEGFSFSILEESSVEYKTMYSEHYLENGSFVTDHLVHKPIKLTQTGIITEVVQNTPVLQEGISQFDGKLDIIGVYAPELTDGAQQQFNEIATEVTNAVNFVDGAISNAKSFFDFLGDLKPGISEQQKNIDALNAIRKAGKQLTIESYIGNGAFENMLITDIRPTNRLSEFGKNITFLTIVFEEVRFSDSNLTTRSVGGRQLKALGRTANQKASKVRAGIVQGVSTKKNVGFLKSFF